MNHATLPWHIETDAVGDTVIVGAHGGLIATMEAISESRRDEDAHFIVTVCNSYYQDKMVYSPRKPVDDPLDGKKYYEVERDETLPF